MAINDWNTPVRLHLLKTIHAPTNARRFPIRPKSPIWRVGWRCLPFDTAKAIELTIAKSTHAARATMPVPDALPALCCVSSMCSVGLGDSWRSFEHIRSGMRSDSFWRLVALGWRGLFALFVILGVIVLPLLVCGNTRLTSKSKCCLLRPA